MRGSEHKFTSLVDLLRVRATLQADQTAYSYLESDDRESSLSYSELEQQARAVASLIQSHGGAGQRVLLLYPPGLEFLAGYFGCLFAGAVAVPAYPPNPARLKRTLPRLQSIVSDAQPVIALTTAAILPMIQLAIGGEPGLQALRWSSTDDLPADADRGWQPPAVEPGSLAMLQYTSGSTSQPKGVMLTHANLLHNLSIIESCFETAEHSRAVFWLPLYHDMGLIGGILETAYCGGGCTLMSPLAFLQRPMRWLEAVSRTRCDISGGPNFAYELCVQRSTPEQRAKLDLSNWTLAFTGSEPIRADTLDRFAAAFAPSGFSREAFYPCYGLAEGTLAVTGGLRRDLPLVAAFDGSALEENRAAPAPPEAPAARTLVGCGRIRPSQNLVIADPTSHTRKPDGEIGEIWVASPSVAAGYWNRPEVSRETFAAMLADTGEGPFMRTGDLGFVRDGELFVTGRLKDLIIIAGRNIYPHDVERVAEVSHPAIRSGCSAAFGVDLDGQERLVLVAELERTYGRGASAAPGETAPIVTAVRQAITTHHDVAVHEVVLLAAGAIPKTSSGKIQRHACRIEYQGGGLKRWAPMTTASAEPAASEPL